MTYRPSPWQQEFHACKVDFLLGAGSAGPGKALATNEHILTQSGWKRMGDIHAGDVVFSERGEPCNVLGESPVMFDRQCFEVEFDDGSVVVADGEHVWLTMDYNERQSFLREEKRGDRTGMNDQRHKRRVAQKRTTLQIAETLRHNGRVNHCIPNAAPLQMPAVDLPLPPYILGLWLGDGTKSPAKFGITKPDQEVSDAVGVFAASLGCTVSVTHSSGGCPTWMVVNRAGHKNPALELLRGLFPRLAFREYGVPMSYLLASEAQRWELLDGLVDSDGHVGKDGCIEICLCHEQLAQDVVSLVCSLGFKPTLRSSDAKLYGRVVRTRYRICFSNMGRPLGRIARKRGGALSGTRTSRWRYITAVRAVESVPVKCILVDSPSHLFLVGRRLVPTHNTTALVMDPLQQIIVEHQRCADKNHPYKIDWGKSRGWALHVRRELTQLEETIVNAQRMYQEIDPGVDWEAKSNTLVFSSGYRMQFGHCQNSDDHRKYLSRSFTHLAMDEMSEFEKKQADGLRSRVRSSDPILRQMLKTRACTNPGVSPGQHPNWVREMFVDPHRWGRKILEKKLKRRDGTWDSYTYMYLPATLYDNPDAQFVSDYELKLLDLPEHIRKAYLEGDWYHQAGAYFASDFDQRIHVVKPYQIPRDWPKFRSIDWGFKSPGCITWWAIDDDGNLVCFEELNFREMMDVDVAQRVKDIESRIGLWNKTSNESRITGPADTQIWEERGNSAERIVDVFLKNGVRWEQADKSPGSRRAHAERVLKRLKSHYGRTQLPGIMFFDHCTKLITTLQQIPADPNNPDEPKKGGDDHAYDSCAYAVTYATRGAEGIHMNGEATESDEWSRWASRGAETEHGSRWGLGSGYR